MCYTISDRAPKTLKSRQRWETSYFYIIISPELRYLMSPWPSSILVGNNSHALLWVSCRFRRHRQATRKCQNFPTNLEFKWFSINLKMYWRTWTDCSICTTRSTVGALGNNLIRGHISADGRRKHCTIPPHFSHFETISINLQRT